MSVALSGQDTINIQNRIFQDLADGDCVNLTFPNAIAEVKVGKNGNTIYGLNTTGQVADVTIRVMRASNDDKFLTNLLTQQNQNFSSFPQLIGQFIKKVGTGGGNVTNDTYILGGGVFVGQVEAKNNVEGDTSQSVSIYKMRFAQATRVIT